MEVLWDPVKNDILLETRGVSFPMVLEKILTNDFRGPETNPARDNQYRIIVYFERYPFVVPFVIDADGNWFLKTIYPSRKEKRGGQS
ncbi:MAG: toxin [Spirochaetales bacterium]|nr:toxin [Spirochaetales bacterium]